MSPFASTREQSIAERLQQVVSAEGVHLLLCEIAANPDSRWTRSQILYYLPVRLHGVAEEYFVFETLVIPKRRPFQFEEPNPVDLEQAFADLEGHRGYASATETDTFERPKVPPIDALQAEPPSGESDVIGNVLAALLEEAKVVDREFPKQYRLTNGRCVGPQGEHFVYTFHWSSEPDLFVPGELLLGPTAFPARVGRQGDGDGQFELWVDTFLGPSIGGALFRIDPTFLLRAAFEHLKARRDVFDSGAPQARALFRAPEPIENVALPSTGVDLNPHQRKALSILATANLAYVWGPPGTGKTTTLGYLIRHLANVKDRILVLSPYNVAVDEALISAKRRGEWGPEEIVRVGRISDSVRALDLDLDSLLERRAARSGLLSHTRAFHASVMVAIGQSDHATPASVRKCLEELGECIVKLEQDRTKRLRDGVRLIRQAFRQPERELIRNARVVGTTVALSYISPVIHERLFDQIVVDEASVLRVPEAIIVALAATGRLGLVGDPKQLPPIVRHRSPASDRWLKRNPFDLAGIQRPVDARGSCVMLNEQHRMAPPIRHLISDLFYEGTLVDGEAPTVGRLVFVSTSLTSARTTTKWVRMSPSKENVVHRGVTAAILTAIRSSDSKSSILVLSPYLAQKRAYDAEATSNRIPGVRFATVHTSQGSESDVVIVDLLLAPGRGKSRFMNERSTPEFRNLMNVAMSRARRQLILVGHDQYIAQMYPGGLLDNIVGHARRHGTWIEIPADLRMHSTLRQAFEEGQPTD